MRALFLVLFFISICQAFAEYCPDCGKVVAKRSSQCLICGFKLQELRLWLEGQKRFIPGLQDPHARHFCPFCSKIHKRGHFYCYHCGQELLKRTHKAMQNGSKQVSSGPVQSLQALLERSSKDPGSLSQGEKESLVRWIQQRPLAALFAEQESDSSQNLGLPTQFPGLKPAANKPPDFLIQQLQSMLEEQN